MRNTGTYAHSLSNLRMLDQVNREINSSISVARCTTVDFTAADLAWFRSPIKGGK